MPVIIAKTASDLDRGDVLDIRMSNDVLSLRLLNRGATLWQLRPTGTGDNEPSLCLGLDRPVDYGANHGYFGVTVGPVANRIAGATFELDGRIHRLETNEGPNQLHGGSFGFGHQLFDVEPLPGERGVRFSHHRPDGQGGYPGNLDVTVTYELVGNRLRYQWRAATDAATPVSLANHAYWNLAGYGTINDHEVLVRADRYVTVDDASLPTGELADVEGTPYDLRTPRLLGDVIERLDGVGIDHCYALDPDYAPAVQLHHPASGRRLDITTTLPGVQVYCGQLLDGSARSGGHQRHAGVCLETQHLPDAVNQPGFPNSVVRPEQMVSHVTDYVFSL